MALTLADIVKYYQTSVQGIDAEAQQQQDRAYGGIVRAGKGFLVERIAKDLVDIAWQQLGGNPNAISFKKAAIPVPLNKQYLERIKNQEVADYIRANIHDYTYPAKTDLHVSVDKSLVMAIECKAYTENAMMKRILVDFTLLHQVHPDLTCVLLELESQLTGDYSKPGETITYGSPSTHTLLSYFDVDLHIITLLEGERRVDRPIHKKEYFKPLCAPNLQHAVNVLKDLLAKLK